MNDTSGTGSETPLAFFDPVSSCWRMSQQSLLSAAPESLARLPGWGTTHDGVLYQRQPSVFLIVGSDGSVLPTPPEPTPDNGEGPTLTVNLLPTPTSRDHKDTGDLTKSVPHDDSLLPRAIAHHVRMLPTPTVGDAKSFGPGMDWRKRRNHPIHVGTLPSVLMNQQLDLGSDSSDPPPFPPTNEELPLDSSSG